jgi:hypothetical protein
MTGSAQVGKARKTRTTPRMTTASVTGGAAPVSRPARQPALGLSFQLAFSHADLLESGDPTVNNLRQF